MKNKTEIKEVPVSQLNEAAYNPRISLEPGMAEYEKLKNSIDSFGVVEPIVWNKRTGNVVGGHQRLAVLKAEGRTSIPCSVVDLSEKDERLLNLALNKIRGEWDLTKLKEILSGLDPEDIDLSGFWDDEAAIILSDDIGADYHEEQEEPVYEDISKQNVIITLKFDKREDARAWLEHRGYSPDIVKKYGKTSVLFISEGE